MNKYCSGCKETKDILLFSKNKAMKDGYANWCKACLKKLWQKPENIKRRKERRFDNYARTLYTETKSRARLSGIKFNLDLEDFVIPEFCPVLNIPMATRFGGRMDNTPTVDKKIPSLGYVKGNVFIISWLANKIKNDCCDPEVFQRIAEYLRG